ncbi:hypothetical protein B9Z65_4108 [Elsinoe australis]|uniref:RNase III domain-containing protein n=1 Tax=Elsinoe australis TaxID=40998 RepID=A0A2P7Z1V7_9PEZI|nr:hypothetical protein B9Z65_4108 [Elsinoe australis]
MTFAGQRKVDAALAIVGEDLNQDLVWEALQMPGSGVTLINGRRVLQGHNSLAGVGDRVAALVIIEDGHLDELLTSQQSNAIQAALSNANLALVCDQSGVTGCINMNPSQRVPQTRTKSAAVEAIIGAAYLTGGVEVARRAMQVLGVI